MNFLNPFFLLGILAVALPIIIHLINLRRPKKVAFSTLSFFNELRKSTIRRIRIKQYVLLALRALAILFLALALARPFLPPTLTGTTGSGEAKSIGILIDNSASMNRVGSSGPLFDQARSVTDRIIRNANSNDKFLIQTTNESDFLLSGFTGATKALNYLEKISPVNRGHYTREQFRALYHQLQDAPRNQSILYVISDGQQSQLSDLEDFKPDTKEETKPVSVQLIELEQATPQNIAVASLSLESQMLAPGSPITLAVDVENTGDAVVANQFVSLQLEDEVAGQYETTLQPGETKEFLFELMPEDAGDLTGQIILEGDEVDYDNNHYFAIRIPESRSILLVDGGDESSSFTSYLEPTLEAARETNARLNFEKKLPDDISQDEWSEYDGVVLNGLKEIPQYWHSSLREYVQDGGGVLFLPSEKGDIENYNQFFSLLNAGRFANVIGEYGSFNGVGNVGSLEEGHPILEDIFSKEEDEEISIDSPSLFYYYDYELAQNAMPILKAANNDPLLAEHTFGEGVMLTSAFGLDPGWSNFPVNPFFAPFYYRAVLYTSSPESGGLQQHRLGQPFEWEGAITETDLTLDINDADYKPDIQRRASGVQLTYQGREWEPGILTISAQEKEFKIGVNQDIMESQFGTLDEQQWQQMLSDNLNVSEVISANQLSVEQLDERLNTAVFGKEIWNWFIWIALLFLVIETLISRLYKAESIS